MSYLLDTNVVSELRRGERAHPGVRAWFEEVDRDALHLSVLVIAELRLGAARIGRRDRTAGDRLDGWVDDVRRSYAGRTLVIDAPIAERWARLSVPDRLPLVDGMLAATALQHDLTLVTRNGRDVERTGVRLLDPFLV